MASIPITATPPRIQYIASAGQTVFNVPYIFFSPTDLNVYYTPVNTVPSDLANILIYNVNYTVTQNFVTYTGTITLNVAANAGDHITIVRNMPNSRANFYAQGGSFTSIAVNTDFESEVLMIQQNTMYDKAVTPHYNLCATPIFPNDIFLPVLAASQIWAKDPTNTFMEAIGIPSGGGAGDIVFPVTNNAIAKFQGTAGLIASSGVLIDSSNNVTGINNLTIGTIIAGLWNGTIISPTFGGTGINNGTNTLTLAGNHALTGAFASTFVITAPTTVTFPTSGTLATTSQLPTFPLAANLGGTGISNAAASTITLAGPITTTGAFGATFNFTGTTSVTFPTSGTLSTTTGTVTAVTGTAPIASSGGNTPAISLNGTATAGQVLQSATATTTAYSTATYPATTTINQLLYSSAANVIGGLVTANSGLLVTSNAGVPSILAGPGTTGQILQSNTAASPSFSTASYPSTTTINQILYSSAANTVAGLATANSGTLVTSSTGVPSIASLAAMQVLIGVTGGTPAVGFIPGVNRIVNGDQQVWQRGAGGAATFAVPASTTQYCSDRYQISTTASQISTVSQVAGAVAGQWLCKVQRNSGQTGTGNLIYGTSLTNDMCNEIAGNTCTVSISLKAGANFSGASSQVRIYMLTGTGANKSGIGGAFTGNTVVLNQLQTITTTLTNYTFSTGALGAGVTQAFLGFYWVPSGTAGVDDSVSFTDHQFEASPVQTPYDRRNFNDALIRCQPFFQKSFFYGTAPAQNIGQTTGEEWFTQSIAGALTNFSPYIHYNGRMFTTTPALTFFSPSAATAQAYNETAGSACTATSSTNPSDRGFGISTTPAVGTTAGQVIGFHWTSDADVV
jgi:hypothetical protein